MTVFVSFSTAIRIVFWLVVAGIVAGGLLLGHVDGEPVERGEGVTVHADPRGH